MRLVEAWNWASLCSRMTNAGRNCLGEQKVEGVAQFSVRPMPGLIGVWDGFALVLAEREAQ